MEEFTSDEKYEIKDRGTVFVIRNPRAYEREMNPNPFMGKDVLINGVAYIVKGIETHCVSPVREGSRVGLLVEKK